MQQQVQGRGLADVINEQQDVLMLHQAMVMTTVVCCCTVVHAQGCQHGFLDANVSPGVQWCAHTVQCWIRLAHTQSSNSTAWHVLPAYLQELAAYP